MSIAVAFIFRRLFMYTMGMQPVLVTSYVNPDLDGVACMVAYAEFLQKTGTDAVAGIIGEPHVEAVYLLDRFGIPHPAHIPDAQGVERIVLVDASDPVDLEGAVPSDRVIEVIDHREVHEASAFSNAKAQIELVGAASTLVGERFHRQGIVPSRHSAILLCGGIISNTRNLRAGVTTDRDRQMLAWLNAVAQLSEDFWHELFTAKSDVSGGKLAQRIRGDIKYMKLGETSVGIAEIEMLGAEEILTERLQEVARELRGVQQEHRLGYAFLVVVDLGDMTTSLVAPDEESRALVSRALQVSFEGPVARLPRLLMRKQIVPLLRSVIQQLVV